jgi:hypothetical protein
MYNLGSAEDMMKPGVTTVNELLTASKFTDSKERDKIISYLQQEVKNSGKTANAEEVAAAAAAAKLKDEKPAAPVAGAGTTPPAAPPPAAPPAGTGGTGKTN